MTEFAGPSAGAGGITLASVPVYAEYVDGAVWAFSGEYRPLAIMLKTTARINLLLYAKDVFILFSDPHFPIGAVDTCHLAFRPKLRSCCAFLEELASWGLI